MTPKRFPDTVSLAEVRAEAERLEPGAEAETVEEARGAPPVGSHGHARGRQQLLRMTTYSRKDRKGRKGRKEKICFAVLALFAVDVFSCFRGRWRI